MLKKIISVALIIVSCLSMSMLFTGCDGSDDPEVRAYDEQWIRTHDIFGNPR